MRGGQGGAHLAFVIIQWLKIKLNINQGDIIFRGIGMGKCGDFIRQMKDQD